MTDMSTKEFERILDVTFNNADLLRQALTHRSYINEQSDEEMADNERLEFLGDAVLDFLVADMLYDSFPDMSEGELTRLRSALVRTESLAELARALRVGEFLLIGKGEENNGGRERTNNLCRAFEAIVGALYIDSGLEAVREFITPHLTALQALVMEEALHKDARSRLQEWSQANLNVTPNYRLVSTSGPDHNKEFLIEVVLGAEPTATGRGRSKQAASQAAASAALALIKTGRFGVPGE
jgi:ribonuclease-3